ncbi:MAG: hypothetical protein FE835_19530 [Gammaproteobacteria bacterium]|nr:hypothetical protein [Gammaproteobacteria bacterium]
MSRWTDQFEAHPIHATLEWLKESVSKESDDIDATAVAETRRLLKLLSKFEEVLQSIDPEVIPFNQLDSLNTGLRHANITNQINAYIKSSNAANLAEANNQISNQLASLSIIYGLCGTSTSSTLVNDLDKLIDSVSSKLIDKKNTLTEQINSLSSQVTEKEGRLSELSTQIEQNKSEVNSQISEWQNQFSSAQESRSQDFNKWRDEFTSEKNTDIDNAITKYNEALDKNKKEFKGKITEILSDGKLKHQSILELYELTAGDSVGAGYLKNAEDEKNQADTWRRISVSFIIATICWMLFAYYTNSQPTFTSPTIEITTEQTDTKDEDNKTTTIKPIINTTPLISSEVPWSILFITFSISGILLWGSAYSAQQSTKHRKNEKRTRWFALEVKAIDPFISSLNPEQQNALKKDLSEKMFGQFSNDEDSKVIDEHILKVVADTISGILSKLPK